ncbi:CrcB protein [Clostridiales Family XIII bacterium PM5-7]
MNFLAVGLGGALGALARYGLGTIPIKGGFPYMTFLINLTGAILIGAFVGLMMTKKEMNPNVILFVKVGLCGGYTTFSTFSLEVLNLFDEHRPVLAAVYAVVSVMTCIFGVWVGRKLVVG